MSAKRNTALDDFLVAASDRACGALAGLPRLALTDSRFRFVARLEERRHADAGEALSAKEALKEARRDLEFLLQEAEADPEGTVREVLGYPVFLRSFALLANRDRGVFEAALLQLRELGVKDRQVKALEKAVHAERRKHRSVKASEPRQTPELPTVRSILPDAPVPDGARIPFPWRLSEEGVSVESVKATADGDPTLSVVQVAPTPIVISGRLKDVADDTESLCLAWLRDGRWQSHTTGREVAANAREIVELAGKGLPVTSGTASDLVRYCAAFEATNIQELPCAQVSKQMGWQGERGALGFLCGRSLISPSGEPTAAVHIEALDPAEWRAGGVAFRGADTGDEQLADGFHAAGTYEGWIEAVKLVAHYPRVLLALYASLVAAILTVLDAPNFFLDWCNPTSSGKTTTLRVAASVWGCPDERAGATVLNTWDATRVWIERASAVLNNLPLVLDDTKRARQPKAVAQTLYDLASGRGRGRGSPVGMRRAGSWATVGLFSGEAPAVSFTEDGGTRARGLTVWGPPFGVADETTAAVVNCLNTGLLGHYGHAGPTFVGYAIQNRAKWDEWRQQYQCARGAYLAKAGANPVAGRLAAYFATLDRTAVLAHQALDLPWEYRDPIEELWEGLTKEASEADRAAQALAVVMSWTHSHAHEFWGREETNQDGTPRVPHSGWAGKWHKMEDWETIAFLPHKLGEILKSHGFEPDAILRTWRDREWLEVSSDHSRYQKRISMGGDKPWAVVIRRKAVDEAGSGN